MEKEIIIRTRYWGNQNRRAQMSVLNNKVTVQGYSIGYRSRNVVGPRLENIAEVPKKLRKVVTGLQMKRCTELSKAFSAFVAEVWQKAKEQDSWFDY